MSSATYVCNLITRLFPVETSGCWGKSLSRSLKTERGLQTPRSSQFSQPHPYKALPNHQAAQWAGEEIELCQHHRERSATGLFSQEWVWKAIPPDPTQKGGGEQNPVKRGGLADVPPPVANEGGPGGLLSWQSDALPCLLYCLRCVSQPTCHCPLENTNLTSVWRGRRGVLGNLHKKPTFWVLQTIQNQISIWSFLFLIMRSQAVEIPSVSTPPKVQKHKTAQRDTRRLSTPSSCSQELGLTTAKIRLID